MASSIGIFGRRSSQPVEFSPVDPRWLDHGTTGGGTRSIIWSANNANSTLVRDAGPGGIQGPLTNVVLRNDVHRGLVFNGTSSKIEYEGNTTDQLPFTLLLYAKLTSISADRGLISHRPSSGWVWAVRSTGTYQVYDGAAWKDSGVTATLNKPVLSGLTVDASKNLIFYQNGVASATVASALATVSLNKWFTLGAWDSTFGYFSGSIYYGAYIPRMYSPGEMQMLAAAPWTLFAPKPRRLYFAASGGSTYAVSVAESGSAVDSPSATLTFSATTAEVGSTADAPLATGTFAATGAEVGAAVDAPSALATFAATTAEAGTAADTPSATFNTAATTAEAGSAIDTDSAAATFAATVAETGSAVDTPSTGSATYSVSTAESGVASDTPSALAVFAATDAESGTAADAPTATAVVGATVAEAGSAVDTSNVGGSIYAVSTAETGSTVDACSCVIVTSGSIAEGTASAADTASAAAIWAAAIAETGAASDATSAVASMGVAVAESGAATDTPSTTAVMGVSVAETGNAVDTQSAAFPYTLTQDISFTATAAGRKFSAAASGRSYISRAAGRVFTVQ